MSLLNTNDLIDYMGDVAFTQQQLDKSQVILDGVQRQVERYCNRMLEPTLIQERLRAEADGSLYFTYTPVLQLVSIVDQFNTPVLWGMEFGAGTVAALTDADMQAAGVTRSLDTASGTDNTSFVKAGALNADPGMLRFTPFSWYTVKYLTCVQDNLDDVKLEILRVSAREMVRMHDDTLSLKDGIFRDETNPEISGITGFGFTVDELTQFDRLRRRVVG